MNVDATSEHAIIISIISQWLFVALLVEVSLGFKQLFNLAPGTR